MSQVQVVKELTAQEIGSKICHIMDVLTAHFDKLSKKSDEELDPELLIKLAHAVGYQAQVYSTLLKNHQYENRLARIETELAITDVKAVSMALSPAIIYEKDIKES